MRLTKARIQKYRSIDDSGWFDVEKNKTILVGPNEAGKSTILQALQHLKSPEGTVKLNALRDYPRSQYNDISSGSVSPSDVEVVTGIFLLEDADKALLPEEFHDCEYVLTRTLDGSPHHYLKSPPPVTTCGELKKDLIRLSSHMDQQCEGDEEKPSQTITSIVSSWDDAAQIDTETGASLKLWLEKNYAKIDENNQTEEARYDKILAFISSTSKHDEVLESLWERVPIFVLFNNYFRVHPIIHLDHLAKRIEQDILDDQYYDYGNKCLLQLLGFTARELSDLGKANEPPTGDTQKLEQYRASLDERHYQLNAASIRLTTEIKSIWAPDHGRDEADRLRIMADGQYLKVVVEDDLGVEIELNQRSEGFQWLVSFFIVFFAEAAQKHKNAVLLLDEPGLSLHGLKQREFRKTVSRLADQNQTIYTTHSPFLVGPDELDLVRVIELKNRSIGTKVHTTVTASDPAGLLPLQEALGYDLAQSLFGQKRNLVLEGLTDYWYLDSLSELFNNDSDTGVKSNIALVPANSASKVVYFATILHAQNLKVAALLDSDSAGEQAASQDTLVNSLGNKAILRTKDVYDGSVKKPEIEDLLRDTLVEIARNELSWDITAQAAAQTSRPIIDIFQQEIGNFSKYKLAKTFMKWCQSNDSSSLSTQEIQAFQALFDKINKALK